jgi:hypothetical protein
VQDAPPAAAEPAPPFSAPPDPQAAFELGLTFTDQERRAEAITCFLAAFRAGPPDLRRQAVAELEKLGEVDTF